MFLAIYQLYLTYLPLSWPPVLPAFCPCTNWENKNLTIGPNSGSITKRISFSYQGEVSSSKTFICICDGRSEEGRKGRGQFEWYSHSRNFRTMFRLVTNQIREKKSSNTTRISLVDWKIQESREAYTGICCKGNHWILDACNLLEIRLATKLVILL